MQPFTKGSCRTGKAEVSISTGFPEQYEAGGAEYFLEKIMS